jgi:hypothetical protein
MRLLYDEFACFCPPALLQNSLDVVQKRLDDRRASGKPDVALLPLPTEAKNLARLRRLYRYDVYRRYYENAPGTGPYLARIQAYMASEPRWLDDRLAKLTAELEQATHYVYGSRDKRYLLDAIPALLAEADDPIPEIGGVKR